jgi:hypothetical protein
VLFKDGRLNSCACGDVTWTQILDLSVRHALVVCHAVVVRHALVCHAVVVCHILAVYHTLNLFLVRRLS